MVRRQGVRDRDAVDVVHQQGGRCLWTGLAHHGDRSWHGHAGLGQRRQDPVFALDAVGARVDRRARRAAQNPLGHRAADEQRLVGVPAGEGLDLERPGIAADLGDPRGKPRVASARWQRHAWPPSCPLPAFGRNAWPGTIGVGSKGGRPQRSAVPRLGHSVSAWPGTSAPTPSSSASWRGCASSCARRSTRWRRSSSTTRRSCASQRHSCKPSRSRGCGRRTLVPSSAVRDMARSSSASCTRSWVAASSRHRSSATRRRTRATRSSWRSPRPPSRRRGGSHRCWPARSTARSR